MEQLSSHKIFHHFRPSVCVCRIIPKIFKLSRVTREIVELPPGKILKNGKPQTAIVDSVNIWWDADLIHGLLVSILNESNISPLFIKEILTLHSKWNFDL